MKCSKHAILARLHKLPRLRFEDQQLTSYAGTIVFQLLFQRLDLKARLKQCFPAKSAAIFAPHLIVLWLILHLLLGFRRLRDIDYYRDDPVVLRLLGLRRLPDVATVSRALANMGPSSVERVRHLSSTLVVHALQRGTLPPPDPRLRRFGVFHVRSCRRDRRRLQPQEERGAQLLQPVLHRGPNRAILRCPAPARQRPRQQGRSCVHDGRLRSRARRTVEPRARVPTGQRLLQSGHADPHGPVRRRMHDQRAFRTLSGAQGQNRVAPALVLA